jgi:type II secretory pathway pseudopilin PulG
MKLSNQSKVSMPPGMTLIEVTVVIVVLLTLIWVFYFSATGYIKASNRSACLANQANLQKAVRGFQNLNSLGEASTFSWSSLDSQGFITNPSSLYCPTSSAKYLSATEGVIPPLGTRAAPCVDLDYADEHTADSLAQY